MTKAAIDTRGFRFGQVKDIHSPDFLPGGARYHDLPGMLAVAAPGPLWLAGEGAKTPSLVAAAYQASGGMKNVVSFRGEQEQLHEAAIKWLLDGNPQ